MRIPVDTRSPHYPLPTHQDKTKGYFLETCTALIERPQAIVALSILRGRNNTPLVCEEALSPIQ